MAHRNLLRAVFTMLLLCMGLTVALAQNTSVSGVITDPQNGAIAGATVTLTNKTTNTTRTVTSTSDGTYQFPQVVPGLYQLRAEAQGFKALVRDDVQVLVSTPLTLNLNFKEIGAVNETVTVQGGETALNTTDATIGNTFNELKIKDLPLNARNVVNLLSLQPGVTAGGNVNGGRSDQANVTLDGVDVNEQQGGRAFFSVLRSTPDSLQEFRVTTTNANADQGRSSGAQVALVTKGGTNEFHGSLYHYHRNTVTSANNWFNNKAKVGREAILRNNFGGSIGGPILKDKFFFFFNYEGFREARGTSVVREVPLASLGQGIVKYRTSNGSSDAGCPAGTPTGVNCLTRAEISAAYLAANNVDPGTNSAAVAVLAGAAQRYVANDTTVGDGLNTSGFRFNASTPSKFDTYIGRFDFNINSKHNLFARLNYQNDTITAVRRFPDTPAPTTWVHPKGTSIGHAWTISNSLVNNFRYGLTRDSFTVGGDSSQNFVNFRFIYDPFTYSRGLSRTTPVHNIIDDLSWIKGKHSLQFGTNIRLVTNNRTSFATAYDTASMNPSFYDLSGDIVLLSEASGAEIFPSIASGFRTDLRDALTSVIGRYTGYSANLNYDRSGKLIPSGQGVGRSFRTEESEFYGQDSWRLRNNLTITAGLRWSTSTPIYETGGFEVKPQPSLSEFFANRVAGAVAGNPYNQLIKVDLSGKVNGKSGFYNQDWDNFAPSIAVAWSPNPKNRVLKALIGGDNKTTIRGGYRITYDRIGSALAVGFDLNNTLGFSSSKQISANTFNVGSRLGPLFTQLGQNVRGLPRLTFSNSIAFPLQTPDDEDQRIESSLDDGLVTPYNHSFNLSYGRELGKGFLIETSYVGRLGRNLLVSRDTAHLNNLVDPKSGVDFYTAMRQLIGLREQNVSIASVQRIPYFENLLPGLAGNYSVLGQTTALTASQAAYRRIARSSVGGRGTIDYTFVQLLWDDGLGPNGASNLFFHPQYATFGAYSTIGTSDYNSLQVNLQKRLSNDNYLGFNYTYSHSLDIASGNESSGSVAAGASLILNPLDLKVNRGNSDFDARHLINANFGYSLPFGKGRRFFSNMPTALNFVLGGWRTSGIYRWNTGFPIGDPFDDGRWATNWNVQSNGRLIRSLKSSPTRTGDPNLFGDPTAAYQSYRLPYPGEVGDRNVLRAPAFQTFDLGVYKEFKLPIEQGKVIFRWETFNLTNTQYFSGAANRRLGVDPYLGGTPPSDFYKFTGIQGEPRIMQFALRIEF